MSEDHPLYEVVPKLGLLQTSHAALFQAFHRLTCSNGLSFTKCIQSPYCVLGTVLWALFLTANAALSPQPARALSSLGPCAFGVCRLQEAFGRLCHR